MLMKRLPEVSYILAASCVSDMLPSVRSGNKGTYCSTSYQRLN